MQQFSLNASEETQLQQMRTEPTAVEKTNLENVIDEPAKSEFPFSSETFDLLRQLRIKHTLDFYLTNEEKFKKYVEKPFQKLFRQVAAQLPEVLTKHIDMEREIFAYPKWGLHYQGAFFHKNSNSIRDVQLFIHLHHYTALSFGLIVDAESRDKKRFIHNYRTKSELKEIILQHQLPNDYSLGESKKAISLTRSISFEDWLKNIAQKNSTIGTVEAIVRLKNNEVLLCSNEQLITQITQAFERLFPLFLLATYDDPIPALIEYSNPIYQLNLPLSYQLRLSSEPAKLNASQNTKLRLKYTLTQCADDISIEAAELERWVRIIKRKKQAILYGSPGTGKTYTAERIAQHLTSDSDGFSELVQFHPAYAYEDFIQGIRPQARLDGGLDYQLVPGRFLEFCKRAESCEGLCVLIIDEINRANLAQVFGELMYLLEYRDKTIPLAGSSKPFGIPKNVRIIGTMNTADRSIALVDHALRRRFAFIELRPNYNVLRRYHQRNTGFLVDGLIETLKQLNNAIADKHYEIGISFFLTENLADELEDIWQMEIEPYLEEYFYDQLHKVDEFRWDNIKQQVCP